MASFLEPKLMTLKASAAIALGKAVTIDSTGKIVTAANAASDKQIGIAQNAATVANDFVEIALPGGGAKALAGGSISAGDLLTSTTGGALIATTSTADRVIAVAMQGASSGDLFGVVVVIGAY